MLLWIFKRVILSEDVKKVKYAIEKVLVQMIFLCSYNVINESLELEALIYLCQVF